MALKASHEMFVQALIKNGGRQTEAYMEVYKAKPDTSRHGGSFLMRNVEVRRRVSELLESQGLGIVELNKKLKALTGARKDVNNNGDFTGQPDNNARLQAIKIAYKLHGLIGANIEENEIFLMPEQIQQLSKDSKSVIEEEV